MIDAIGKTIGNFANGILIGCLSLFFIGCAFLLLVATGYYIKRLYQGDWTALFNLIFIAFFLICGVLGVVL